MNTVNKLYRKCCALLDFLRPMDIPLHSAHTCFFLVLSLFPALLLFLGLLRYTDYGVQDVLELAESFVPASLMPTVQSLLEASYRNSSGMVISVSVLATLWSASKGTYGLLIGLSAVYGMDDPKGYWRRRGISVVYTFLFLVVLVLTLVIHVFGNALVDYLWMRTEPALTRFLQLVNLQFVALFVIQSALFSLIYALLPSPHNRLREGIPGAVLASLGWLSYTKLFSVYVEHFSTYTNIFGSVYALALGMLWLYFCINILFYGAAFNRLLARRKR